MKPDFNKKYTTISVYVVITFTVCLLLVALFLKFSEVIEGFKVVATILAPVTWGIVIAYVANPFMKIAEKFLRKLLCKKKDKPKLIRTLSVSFSMFVIVAIITALISILLPEVIKSIIDIGNNFSGYLANIQNFIEETLEKYPEFGGVLVEQFETFEPKIMEYINGLLPKIGDFAVLLGGGAWGLLIGLKDFLIGFIVAIYILASKEKFLAQMKKGVVAVFPHKIANGIINISAHTNNTVSNFFLGKMLDSFIIGILCFICMSLFKMDFVALISVVIGVTNIIPFFGPFFGAIPSAFLLLVASPDQVITFLIFILILQQFDGNILGPMILGDSTGLSPFWVMVAIFVGGGLFGFAGMVLGVPLFAVIYTLVSDLVNFILEKKGLNTNTDSYIVTDIDREIKKSKLKSKHQNYFKNLDENENSIEETTDKNVVDKITENKNSKKD